MSLVPRWFSRLPGPKRSGEGLFNINKFFEDFGEELVGLAAQPSGLSVSADDKNIYVEAQVPGLTSKEVEVSIDNNNMLWIRGEKKEEEKDKNKQFYRKSQTVFSYCVPLWDEVDVTQEPEAVVKDGVMKITFAKTKEKQVESKKIKVKE